MNSCAVVAMMLVLPLCMANLPVSAAQGHRRILNDKMPDIGGSQVQAQASASASAVAVSGDVTPIAVQPQPADCHDCYKGQGKPDLVAAAITQAQAAASASTIAIQPAQGDDKEKDEGGHPDFATCQAAASAFAASTAFSTGKAKDDECFNFAKSKADAAAVAGSEDWKNKFIGFCGVFASATATSIAASGK